MVLQGGYNGMRRGRISNNQLPIIVSFSPMDDSDNASDEDEPNLFSQRRNEVQLLTETVQILVSQKIVY
ncbi:hypothetical protein GCM10023229_33060 [Flavisolibacter ginsenosidimutans]